MNKKLVILIEIVVCIMAIIVISIFGINPETWRDFEYCKSINFVNNGEDVERVELEIGTLNYQLEWVINPETATNKTIYFTYNNDNVIISSNGLVTFLRSEGVTIIINTKDGTNLRDSIRITFIPPTNGGGIILD